MQINKHAIWLWAYIIASLLAVVFMFLGIRSCVAKKNKEQVAECTKDGDVRQLTCDVSGPGRIFQICKAGKWVETFNDCKKEACSETVFDRDVKPLFQSKCVSCHTGWDTYDNAKAKAPHFIERTSRADGAAGRMPQAPKEPLSQEDKDKFKLWQEDGLLESCPGSAENTNPQLDLDYVETAILADLNVMSSADQLQARYLITSHKSNERAAPDVLKQFERAVNKSLNNLSFARDIVLAVPIDQYTTVYRFLLRDVRLNTSDWKIVEDADKLGFESFTNQGVLIKSLTKARLPWMILDGFAFFSNQAPTYYALRKLPATEGELFHQLGVNFDRELNDFSALFVGFSDSPIALNKNRLIVRVDSNDGELWQSFDTRLNQPDPEANLFKFPLLNSPSGNANFKAAASEYIFSAPNQLHMYYLANARGDRQDKAPIDIVKNTNAGSFSAEIEAGNSCLLCHAQGYLKNNDEVLAAVRDNAVSFPDLRDVEFVEQFYRDPEPVFDADNLLYTQALAKMGISPTEKDPINLAIDNLRRNLDSKAVAALLLLSEETFLDGLSRSAEARQQVGALLGGGQITFEQLVAALPVIIRDLRLFANPL
jgi:hypothetical protein